MPINLPPESCLNTSSSGVYQRHHALERVVSLPDLHRKITVAIATVPVDVLSQVWSEVEFHFDTCRVVSGAPPELP
jgi:hypothetical protein